MLNRRVSLVVLVVILALGLGAPAQPDILFNGKRAQKIGLGTQDGNRIHWTDCQGKNPETFINPPYALDKTDNCTVGPPAFGLECNGETCRVVDEEKLRKYLPGIKRGGVIRLRIQEHSVELRSETETLVLGR